MKYKLPALCVVVGVLVGIFIGFRISAASHPLQRFVNAAGDAPIVLDTKTGQYCNPVPKQTNQLPLCRDL